jgi:peptidoglycan/LPS O-acetylase OafA/YrhL
MISSEIEEGQTVAMQQANMKSDNIAFLRVLAAGSVFAVHMYCAAGQPDNLIGHIVSYGGQFQVIFYVLCGYLVMNSYEKSSGVQTFFLKRAARIMPLYYFDLVLVLLGVACGFLNLGARGWFDIPRGILMLGSILPPSISYQWNSMCGLGIIPNYVIFYLLVPVIYRHIKTVSGAFALLLGAIAMAILTPGTVELLYRGSCQPADLTSFVGLSFGSNAYFIMFGVLLFYGFRDNSKQLFSLLLLLFIATSYFEFLHPYLIGAVFAVFVAVVLYFPFNLGKLGKISQKLSPYTYTFYIMHMFCWPLIIGIKDRLGWHGGALTGVVILVASLGMSFATKNLVERPAASFIMKYAKRHQKQEGQDA